jgi:SAM-dependent methyltransferase
MPWSLTMLKAVDVDWQCPLHGLPGSPTTAPGIECECGCTFSMRNGVYEFVSKQSYADAFGVQWELWSATQLDSFTGTSISRDRLHEAIGEGESRTLSGRRVLEVGCGAGRFTEILLGEGAHVLSIDLSDAAAVNARNFPPSDAHIVARADVAALPLQPEQFDVVLALGMLQHTPSPDATISNLWTMVAPGGTLIFDHYPFGLRHILRLKPLYRQVLKRQRPQTALRVSNKLYDFWAPVHRKLTGRVGTVLLTRISPIVCFNSEFPELSPDNKESWGRLDTFDSLTDWYKHRSTRARLETKVRALSPAQLKVVQGGTDG